MPAFSERPDHVCTDLFHCLLVQCTIPDNAAFSDLLLFELKLRFDEADDVPIRFEHLKDWPEDEGQRNERNIDDNEIDGLRQIGRREVADVKALSRDDPFVAAQFPRELVRSDIIGIDFRGTALEDTIGEAASRGPGIEDDFPVDIESKLIEGFLDLKAASTHELRTIFDFNSRVFLDFEAGLEDAFVPVDTYLAGDDETLRHLARVTEPPSMYQQIESFFSHLFPCFPCNHKNSGYVSPE